MGDEPKPSSLPMDHLAANRAYWTSQSDSYAERAPRHWASEVITWGIWDTPETEIGALGDVGGLDVIELGCGTAYFSAWLARRGARPVGIDITPSQLATAGAMQARFGLRFPLVEASAENVPVRDERFDLALSEYGASIWCDPYRWVPEAARLLRPDGRLVFLRNSTILILTEDLDGAHDRLIRDYFGLHRIAWPDTKSVEFHLAYGDWIRLLRANGFEIENLVEIQAPAGAVSDYELVPAEWAHRWPSEEIWIVRKVSFESTALRSGRR
ncbi:MAG: class I SAM-dependent methyltransferase [Actinomycetota bacterium]